MPQKQIGQPTSRVDGRAKVTGQAKFAAEFALPDLVHGYIVTSTIARGKIKTLNTTAAEKAAGVLAVYTHLNAPKLAYRDKKDKDGVGPDGAPFRALQSDKIYFNAQPIALVVAETFEQARYAASLVTATYHAEKPTTRLTDAMSQAFAADDTPSKPRGTPQEALKQAAVTVTGEYVIPIEHHNPIEPHAAIAVWDKGKLLVYDKTQWVYNDRTHLASVFGIPETDIKVLSPYVGGAFGASLRPHYYLTLTALAARELRRPVKVVYTRRQMFTGHGYRPHTWQRVALGATTDGQLTAIIHEAVGNTSQYENYTEDPVGVSRSLYACPNVHTDYKLVRLDLPTPLYMRAPGTVSGMFALECALDELAHQLKIDPLALRLKNYADKHPDNGKPFSSKALRECYQQAAEKFGWAKRTLAPRSMRDGDLLVGWGMATATWGAFQAPATVRVALKADGTALVQSAASDMGPGTYTTITMIAADALGLPLEKVKFELGNSDLPAAPVHGGSLTTASVGSAAQGACEAVLKKVRALAAKSGTDGAKEPFNYRELLQKNNLTDITETFTSFPNPEREKYAIASHGAQFVEVKVDAELGTVRVTRVVEATAAGKIINPKAAHSQEMGGAVWGIGMALMEETRLDHRFGRFVNPNLAGYYVPVNADIHDIETIFVEEADKIVNVLGVKGLGELGMVGIPAAIANAVWHATGKRIRELPITADKLL